MDAHAGQPRDAYTGMSVLTLTSQGVPTLLGSNTACSNYVFNFLFMVLFMGPVAHGVSRSINVSQYFFVASMCSFICLQAVYQLSGAVCKATWNGYPSYSLLTFISRFVIDFLSIRKVIISPRSLPMIVTPYGHVLYTKMLQIA